ncbi:ABC transporter ATP-binding protein [Aureibacillus halotolerans]|uniref:Iron(III) transport system ATP-binding protein n=1 Tax=Aureibacillus halotolerans TaxID=1508390 RepID=A0A4R6U6Q9_9BACI|nr:ABC transporter ATP-binding protein [Aureibacillus halotolerans]TDQ38714.1 iron(III) transport system ATP-binding protein [Aureibacillus halotolerans]
MSLVLVEQLSYAYTSSKQPVIDALSFTIEQHEVVGILGPSGSGKSTLLRLMAGLEIPLKGTISIAGRTVVNDKLFMEADQRGVGMVFQDYALFPHLTVEKNIMFGLGKIKKREREARMHEMIDLVKLHDLAKRYPHELSGGQQQRVALARALAPKPTILLMDEPFSNLDYDLKQSIRLELKTILQTAGITCLLVSHDLNDVNDICSRVIDLTDHTRTTTRGCFEDVSNALVNKR